MLILGWDTATAATTAARLDTGSGQGGEARHDPAPGERPGHGDRLLALALEAGGWEGVDRLAVGVGPGSFTGLRLGLAGARALALALDLPLAGVSSLHALAAAVLAEPEYVPDVVLAAIDARRGEVFCGAWDAGGAERDPPRAVPLPGLAAYVRALPAAPLAVGDGALLARGELEAAGAVVPEDASPLHRVSAVWTCRLGADAGTTRPEDVLPLYVRSPDAVPRPR